MNVKTLLEAQDIDPAETSEWLDSMQAVIEREGLERAHYLLELFLQSNNIRFLIIFQPQSPFGGNPSPFFGLVYC